MSARDVAAAGIIEKTGASLATIRADAAIEALTAAGYRIIGPGESSGHLCGHCDIGSYEGQVELVPPDFLKRKDGRGICVDVCLALEISELWHKHRIRTTGCCCGHGKDPGYIGVQRNQIDRMKALGYQVRPNECRPGAEDSFYPKTRFASAEERSLKKEGGGG